MIIKIKPLRKLGIESNFLNLIKDKRSTQMASDLVMKLAPQLLSIAPEFLSAETVMEVAPDNSVRARSCRPFLDIETPEPSLQFLFDTLASQLYFRHFEDRNLNLHPPRGPNVYELAQ